jgi:squalene-hopene/tetraprenyl-beta-curcumene cyclase
VTVVSAAAPAVDEALSRACEALRRLQHGDGWWKGELETNVTIDAEDLLLRAYLGVLTPAQAHDTARWVRSKQRPDGTWATFYGGPPDLSTTIEAWAGLRLAGDAPDAAHMRAAAEFVLDAGGIEASRVFTRIWMALFGLWPWEQLPVIPPELVLLPSWAPLNIYDFGCWARQTVVALTIVGTYRPVRSLPFGVDELRTGVPVTPSAPFPSWKWAFGTADRALHAYERRPLGALRRRALARAEQWIVQRQEADGGWGGIQPPWVYSLIALQLRGYPLDHPVMKAGLDGFEGFIINDADGRRLEACQSPVWDTALALIALADAGAAPDDPALVRAAEWLRGEEVRVGGDWAVSRPSLAPGGWAFEFANVNYPDIDDTAEVGLALLRAGSGSPEAVARGREWVLGMRCRDGGWGAFDVDNTRALCRELPFCDFGELIDPPSADVTAHVVEFLAAVDGPRTAIDGGIDWLLRAQERDGSWFGRWGANHVYGTGAAVPALVAAGVAPSSLPVQRAVEWLHRHQNDDGGWGEDLRSYRDPAWRGRGASTASQTAWALLALIAARDPSAAVTRGVEWLVGTQRPDGTWDEPWFTGTGFPGDFYINYHLYRLVFPVMALGRVRHG